MTIKEEGLLIEINKLPRAKSPRYSLPLSGIEKFVTGSLHRELHNEFFLD